MATATAIKNKHPRTYTLVCRICHTEYVIDNSANVETTCPECGA